MKDLIIIGGGIAGETAAIYAARKKMDFLLVATEVGGQFFQSGEILNFPGIIETTGFEFSKTMEKQLEFNKVKPMEASVQSVSKEGETFIVKTDKDEFKSKTLIIATGARPRKLDVPGEKEFERKGVTYCSICDGPLFAGKDVAIIGGGNAALEGAYSMRDIANKIYLINLLDDFTAHEYLVENIRKTPNIEIVHSAKTTRILGDKMVSGVAYEKEGEEHTLYVQGVIIEIGRVPNTELVKGFLELDEHQHVMIDCRAQTSVPGVFAAGDCTSSHEYQYIIAAGQGCVALLKAARYLARR